MDSPVTKLQQWITQNPLLVWSTDNYQNLSAECIVENTLNYGSWQNILEIQALLGIDQFHQYFKHLSNQKRVNLKPQTLNYFNLYFQRYVS